MLNQEDDLDLLLSLQDRVLETPPGSPSAPQTSSPGKSLFKKKKKNCCLFGFSSKVSYNVLIQMLVSTLLTENSIWVSLSFLLDALFPIIYLLIFTFP